MRTTIRPRRPPAQPTPRSDGRAEGPRSRERGAALLVVMVAVAVVTVLAVDLAYDAGVSLRIAGNARDELRATYLAKSGVALQRLVLSFQQDVESAIPKIPGMASTPRPQLWRIVPVSSALTDNLFGAAAPGREDGKAGFADGGPPGGSRAGRAPAGFDVVVDDEGRKVNVQLEALGGPLLTAQLQAIWQLICDARWDALFDREDENGLRVSRQDLLVYLRDWVDTDERGSALAASFPATCVMQVGSNPFEQGFQDENFPYDRGEDRYRAKNARMDSLDELYLVAGVTDAFMAAFGDAITVYLPRDAKRNVNETDRSRLLDLARIVADPPGQPVLYDPELGSKLQKAIFEKTYGGMLSLTPMDFGQIVAALGVRVNTSMLQETSPQNPFTDRSSVFRIRATGRAGDVAKGIDAVVRLDAGQIGQTTQIGQTAQVQTGQAQLRQAQAGQVSTASGRVITTPGQLVHWKED